MSTPSLIQSNSKSSQIQQLVQNVIARTEGMETMYRNLSAKHESFQIHCQENCRVDMVLQGEVPSDQIGKYKDRKQLLDQVIERDADEIKRTVEDLVQRFVECLEEVGHLQQLVIAGELASWKQNQRHFSCEDDAARVELNNIQRWFESLAELLWRLRQLGKQLEITRSRSNLPILQQVTQFGALTQHITELLEQLLIESFVLEKQPPQVIKTSNKFSATIRLLVGSKLQVHLSVPEVVACLLYTSPSPRDRTRSRMPSSA